MAIKKRKVLDERVNLRLPADLKSQVERYAVDEDRTVTSMLRRLVGLGLKQLEEERAT